MVNAQQFRIQVDQQQLMIPDPVPTGRQILEIAQKRPADEFLVFYLLPSGQLEEIRLDETFDLRQTGIERFITFRSDRSFRFVIDGRHFEWGVPLISGLKLKQLAQVNPQAYGVWLEVRGGEDRPIADHETVNLEAPGVERFFTGKKTTTEG